MRSERICVDMRARVCRVCTRIAISGSHQDQDQDQDKDHIPTYPHLALRVPTGPDLENSERLISGRSDLGAGNHLGAPLRQVAQGRAGSRNAPCACVRLIVRACSDRASCVRRGPAGPADAAQLEYPLVSAVAVSLLLPGVHILEADLFRRVRVCGLLDLLRRRHEGVAATCSSSRSISRELLPRKDEGSDSR